MANGGFEPYNLYMPLFLTLIIAKTVQRISRRLGRGGGSALPGLIAESLDRNVLSKLTKSLPDGSIVVTGTNGKTTTTKMLAAILSANGKRVVTNPSGSNLTRGIVSSLIEVSNLSGKLPGDVGLFEVDEASMPEVCRMSLPKKIMVLNLFRDQLDRYGELDKTAEMVGRGIEQTKADVFLNADDPLVASLSKYVKAKVWFFGVEKALSSRLPHDLAADSDHCPECGLALKYSDNWFGHMGHYSCTSKDFSRPKPNYSLTEMQSGLAGEVFEVKLPDGRARFSIELPGLYNAYNALAAIALASNMGIAGGRIGAALQGLSAAFGRVEKVKLQGRTLYLLLIKNPTGFNQVIQTFLTSKVERRTSKDEPQKSEVKPDRLDDDGALNVLIAINDNFADGRDVSWLWDVGVDELATGQVTNIFCSGIRAYDMAVRLKYAGIEAKVETQLSKALVQLIKVTPVGGTAYVLPTYTAMFELRGLITKEAGLEGFWK